MRVIAAACSEEWDWQSVVLVSVALICATACYAVWRYTETRYEDPEDGLGR